MDPEVFGIMINPADKALFQIFTHFRVYSQKIILIWLGTIN